MLRTARRTVRRTVLRALLVGAACAAPVACSTTAGTPPVGDIDDARDVRGVEVCALLDDGRRAALQLGPGVAEAAPEGPRCRWRGSSAVLDITVATGGGGLAVLAERSEPTTARVRLAGYPALETFTPGGAFCQYDVAVADEQVVMAALEGGTPDSCTALQGLVPEVLADLPRL